MRCVSAPLSQSQKMGITRTVGARQILLQKMSGPSQKGTQMNLVTTDYFPTSRESIQKRVQNIEPQAYARTRNYLDGAVTYLSPYITHGYLCTQTLAQHVLQHFGYEKSEKFLFELAWREFFHHVWLHKGDAIFEDMNRAQPRVVSKQLPSAIVNHSTGIEGIDRTIETWLTTGMLHNHARMWIASLVCNFARTDWKSGAKWMHYHLMDGDLASNTLSWQWVAATFSNKPYVFNQDNVNKYARTSQQNTIVDMDYESLPPDEIPSLLNERVPESLPVEIPETQNITLNPNDDIALHHIWNLDPDWKKDIDQHVVLIEPNRLQRNPMSHKRLTWLTEMIQTHLPDAPIIVKNFEDLFADHGGDIHYREYPLVTHWKGIEDPRPWMFDLQAKYLPKFFKFWNHHRKKAF